MLPNQTLSKGGALAALTLNAQAGERAPGPARDACMRCGEVRPVALSIPVRCVGEDRVEYATFCKTCAPGVKR